jgi:hypothetical protein
MLSLLSEVPTLHWWDDLARLSTLTLDTPSEQLVSAFADLDFVTAVQWRK